MSEFSQRARLSAQTNLQSHDSFQHLLNARSLRPSRRRSRLKMPLNWGSSAAEAVIDQKQRTSYHLTYYCLSDREGDCDPPTVTCQCSYWKSPSICCRWGDCEGQVAVFRLMWRSLRSFSLCGPRVLAVMWEKKGRKRKSAGDYRETWIMGLSLGEECDYIM